MVAKIVPTTKLVSSRSMQKEPLQGTLTPKMGKPFPSFSQSCKRIMPLTEASSQKVSDMRIMEQHMTPLNKKSMSKKRESVITFKNCATCWHGQELLSKPRTIRTQRRRSWICQTHQLIRNTQDPHVDMGQFLNQARELLPIRYTIEQPCHRKVALHRYRR